MSHLSSLAAVLTSAEETRDVHTGALAPAAFRRVVHTWTDESHARQLPSSSLLLIEVDWAARPARSEAAAVLRIVADVVRPILRGSDVLGRIDHRTLGILLPTSNTFQAEHVARRLVAAVAARTPDTGHATTVSVGVSSALVDRPWENAAQALSEARALGGDRMVKAPDTPAAARLPHAA